MKKIKEEDLILYLYNECSPGLQASIEAALEEDLELQDRLRILKRTIKQLEKLKLAKPSRYSISEIIKYAAASVRKK